MTLAKYVIVTHSPDERGGRVAFQVYCPTGEEGVGRAASLAEEVGLSRFDVFRPGEMDAARAAMFSAPSP